jgi:aminoglycoside phosphotransferase family enzyme
MQPVAHLLRAGASPPPTPTRVDLVPTHISWVFLTDHDVWKVKRPVRYGVVDDTTLEPRRHVCDEAVRLTRRRAPGVYLGIVPIRLGPAGRAGSGGE